MPQQIISALGRELAISSGASLIAQKREYPLVFRLRCHHRKDQTLSGLDEILGLVLINQSIPHLASTTDA
jgi:hypothetical protein